MLRDCVECFYSDHVAHKHNQNDKITTPLSQARLQDIIRFSDLHKLRMTVTREHSSWTDNSQSQTIQSRRDVISKVLFFLPSYIVVALSREFFRRDFNSIRREFVCVLPCIVDIVLCKHRFIAREANTLARTHTNINHKHIFNYVQSRCNPQLTETNRCWGMDLDWLWLVCVVCGACG